MSSSSEDTTGRESSDPVVDGTNTDGPAQVDGGADADLFGSDSEDEAGG